MAKAKEGFNIPKGKYKFRILVGSHCEGVQVGPNPTDKELVIYKAGEVVESPYDLAKLYSKTAGPAQKFQSLPFEVSEHDRKRYADPDTYSNDPGNPGEVTQSQQNAEGLKALQQQNAVLAAQLQQLLARDAQREAQMAEQAQALAKLAAEAEDAEEKPAKPPVKR